MAKRYCAHWREEADDLGVMLNGLRGWRCKCGLLVVENTPLWREWMCRDADKAWRAYRYQCWLRADAVRRKMQESPL